MYYIDIYISHVSPPSPGAAPGPQRRPPMDISSGAIPLRKAPQTAPSPTAAAVAHCGSGCPVTATTHTHS